MRPSEPAVRAAKIWLDAAFWLGVVGAALIAVYLVVSPLVMRGGAPADIAVPVAIGEGSARPVLRVGMAPVWRYGVQLEEERALTV